jgi:hypothetical protein
MLLLENNSSKCTKNRKISAEKKSKLQGPQMETMNVAYIAVPTY